VYRKYEEDRHMVGGSQCPVRTLTYDRDRPIVITCDFNPDPLVWELVQTYSQPPTYRVFGEIALRNATMDDAVHDFVYRFGSDAARPTVPGNFQPQHPELRALAGGDGHLRPVLIQGDATEEKRTVYDKSKMYGRIKSALREYGFDVRLKVPPSNPPRQQRFQTVNHALANGFLLVAPEAAELRKDFDSGIWNKSQDDMNQSTEDDDGSGLTRSHASSALGYYLAVVHKMSAVTAMSRTGPGPTLPDTGTTTRGPGWFIYEPRDG
jgi:hypothetical protein